MLLLDQYAAGEHPVTKKKGWWNDLIEKEKFLIQISTL